MQYIVLSIKIKYIIFNGPSQSFCLLLSELIYFVFQWFFVHNKWFQNVNCLFFVSNAGKFDNLNSFSLLLSIAIAPVGYHMKIQNIKPILHFFVLCNLLFKVILGFYLQLINRMHNFGNM